MKKNAPNYYGRGTLMTRGAEEYFALNQQYDGTAYDVYPDYGYTGTPAETVCTAGTDEASTKKY